ncbi:NRDE family protein [Pseudomonas matsuisoli]|nr:NRDE family protein [Pseudomonas matsuisoli]
MCLIVFAWQLDPEWPLIMAANRDEFHARPALPFAAWQDLPTVHAGRDLEAGGSWMGVGANQRFAALTNIRDPSQTPGQRSRGELVAAYLTGSSRPETYLKDIMNRPEDYTGFNLLVGDDHELWHLNSARRSLHRLEPGLYGVSNDDLDTPWPKLERSKAAFQEAIDGHEWSALFALLQDRSCPTDEALPMTGVPLETERLLSSTFIVSPRYGTRASTVLLMDHLGQRHVEERAFDPEGNVTHVVEWVG